MQRLLKYFGLIVFTITSIAAYSNGFHVTGVKGKLLENIHKRLEVRLPIKKQKTDSHQKLIKQQVLKAMQPFGYYTPIIVVNGANISIEKGPPVRIAHIELIINGPGRTVFKKRWVKLGIQIGDIFQSDLYEKSKEQLFNVAEHHGYLKAHFNKAKVTVSLKDLKAYVYLHFDTGKQFFFGDVTFSKVPYDKDFLRKFIPYPYKSPYNTQALLTLTENLNSSGYFGSVVVTPHISNKTHVPIDVTLTSKPTQNYTLGAGYGTDTGFRGRAGVKLLHIDSQGHTFEALLQGSQKQNSLQAKYKIPGANPVTSEFNLSANFLELDYPVGKSSGVIVSGAYLHHQENKQYTLSLNALHERFRYPGLWWQSASVVYPMAQFSLRRVSGSLFPKYGHNLSLKAQAAHKEVVSNVNFFQVEAIAKAAVWLPTRTRVFVRGTAGYTATNNPIRMPLSLQLLAGGSDSIRGYSYQSIGLGNKELTASVELQQETFKDWYVTGFYDLGDVYSPTPLSVKRGIGGGLMWASPVGPIRVYLARAFDFPGKPYKIVFAVGPDL